MEKRQFNSMLYNKVGCELNKSMYGFGPIRGCIRENDNLILNDTNKKKKLSASASCNCGSVDYLVNIRDSWSLISDDTFLIIDNNGDGFSVYLDIKNSILKIKINNSISFMNKLESFFSNYLNLSSCPIRGFKSYYYNYMSDTQSSCNNSWINSYLHFEIRTYIKGDTDNDSSLSNSICIKLKKNFIYIKKKFICIKKNKKIKNKSSSMRTRSYSHRSRRKKKRKSLKIFELDMKKEYNHLWAQCQNCHILSYTKSFAAQMDICDFCGYHFQMSSSNRITLLIDPGTWNPINDNLVSRDPLRFHSKRNPYKDRIRFYKKKTGLTEAVQTGLGQLNAIKIAIGVMDFKFMGGSMGSAVGEKITRLIEYAIKKSIPVVIVCASGGARMQEGSLSLMQMAKISSASYNYQLNKKLFYVSILTSPTAGGVTASFAMLGDVIISEPNTYIAFAGKRIIEQTLQKGVPEKLQVSEYLFRKGLFDSIVPRYLLKGVLNELFQLHGFL
uniref:Acetyl-coenzyme A carboxylase carboxyl transferase subunit beta, chloroplastic n=1 Tax=Zostera marina TaxID=29655 RepID=A0A290Y2I2_ZOSMR|nr:acetyl-CoA carboxylase carboxyltransferase beta subunit [Zostera marina]ATD85232.1 acetyl-CoA carboxylase carboxyltransferase beta subunit [Zostera marina]